MAVYLLVLLSILPLYSCAEVQNDDKRIKEAVEKETRALKKDYNRKIGALEREIQGLKKAQAGTQPEADGTKPDLGGGNPNPPPPPVAKAPSSPTPKQEEAEDEQLEPGEMVGGEPDSTADTPPPEDYRKYRVKSVGLNVRSGPSTEFSIVRVLKRGDIVEKLGSEGHWLKIGENEYVSLPYLSVE